MSRQTFNLANDPRGSKQMQGDKDGQRKEEGNAKKELIDLQEDCAGFIRAKRPFSRVGYVYVSICRLKSERTAKLNARRARMRVVFRNTKCSHMFP